MLAIGIALLLMLIVQWSLKSYTRHGESIAVPDLRGKSLEQAIELLDDKGLEYHVMDSVFDTDKPPMSIVEQNPKPGSGVKTGRTIYVVVNATATPMIELPDLIGRSSLKFAKMQLESYGLKVGEPIYKPDPHLNAVIGLMVNGRAVTKKTKVPKGATVILVLGDGLGNSRITVPYLLGLRYDEAEFKLKGYSLNVGALVVDEGVTDTMGAVVYRQLPAYGPGNSIRLGEAIDLWLAKEMPEEITVDPSLYDVVDSVATQ